jgi:hypothetical protein
VSSVSRTADVGAHCLSSRQICQAWTRLLAHQLRWCQPPLRVFSMPFDRDANSPDVPRRRPSFGRIRSIVTIKASCPGVEQRRRVLMADGIDGFRRP